MAWTTIPDANLAPDAPARSVDALALRDNPIAIAGGLSGAPKVVDAALDTTATTTGRDWVLARTALAAAGAVGTYAFLSPTSDSTTYAFGDTAAGSALTIGSVRGAGLQPADTYVAGGTPSGTWRCMGSILGSGGDYEDQITVWLRIS